MADKKLFHNFEQDTRKFLNELNGLLTSLDRDGVSSETVNSIFRCAHSIKSEADYIGLREIADEAHRMENIIEPLREITGPTAADKNLVSSCFYAVDRISALLSAGNEPEISLPEAESSSQPDDYSSFELMLLKEAEMRGEQLYGLSFSISEEESMKYPRVYLVISNLEMNHNVIRIFPDLDNADPGSISDIRVVLSTTAGREELIEEIDVDLVDDVSVRNLSFREEINKDGSGFIPEPDETAVGSGKPDEEDYGLSEQVHERILSSESERIISVEASEIDAISSSVSEIKQRISDLAAAVNDKDAMSKLEQDLAGLESISFGIEKMMNELRTVDPSTYFSGYRNTVESLAERLGKNAVLVLSDGERIDRDLADFIAEPILQLLRNAVVHGIEAPEVRMSSGKQATGVISLSAAEEDGCMVISVTDDGAGVDENAARNAEDDEELLQIIAVPGFTTYGGAESHAGRGVGLDLVASRLQRRGGTLELQNRPGEGCTFRMIFPATD